MLGRVAGVPFAIVENLPTGEIPAKLASRQRKSAHGTGTASGRMIGRERETTNKPTKGFDAQYPIREDWPCPWIKVGEYTAHELLKSLKRGLPYLLRFETVPPKSSKPHPDYLSSKVKVPDEGMSARELLKLVTKALVGWQATAFPGHMILYKESKTYNHGKRIWPA